MTSEPRKRPSLPLLAGGVIVLLVALASPAISGNDANLLEKEAIDLFERGKYEEAESRFKQALEIQEKTLSDTIAALNNLAAIHQLQGNYIESERYLKRALAFANPDDPRSAGIMTNLAAVYQYQGRYTDAELLFRRALNLKGSDTPNTLNQLAILYQHQGRYAEAERLLMQALSIQHQEAAQLDRAVTLNNLGALYQELGRYAEADPLLVEALAIRRKALGDNHPAVALTASNLAGTYKNQGRFAEAEQLLREALRIQQQTEAGGVAAARTLNDLAVLAAEQKKYEQAAELYEKAGASFVKLGGQNQDVAVVLDNLLQVLGASNRKSEFDAIKARIVSGAKER